jgi:hypothetical protein
MRIKKIELFIFMALGIVGATSAATISWSADTAAVEGDKGNTLSAGLFNTEGTFVMAENVGGSAITFDGIDFAEGTITFDGGVYSKFHSKTTAPLSSRGTYGTSTSNTVSLTGLTSGQEYRIQALIYDGRGRFAGRTVEFDGINQGQYANGTSNVTWGPGMLVTGIFTADATTQDFTIEAFGGENSVGGQLNAITLYATNSTNPPPPVWDNPIVVAVGFVGRPYSDTLNGKATDPNGNPITFSLATSTPDWLSVSPDGSITNIRELEADDIGTNDFYVVADGGASGSSTSLLQIVIEMPITVMISNPISNGSEIEISWQGLLGKTYSVETNGNLIQTRGWSSLVNNLPGTGELITFTNTISNDQTFYRVIAK